MTKSTRPLPPVSPDRKRILDSKPAPVPYETQVKIVNRYNDGLSMREVAGECGVSVSTVSRTIAKARAQEEEVKERDEKEVQNERKAR